MRTITIYIISIIMIVAVFFMLVFVQKYTNEKCIEKGGQIIVNAGPYHNACILPKGVQ